MPQLVRDLGDVVPPFDTVEAALDTFRQARHREGPPSTVELRVSDGQDSWEFDELPDFLRSWRAGGRLEVLRITYGPDRFELRADSSSVSVAVALPTSHEVRDVVANLPGVSDARSSLSIVIGHGRSPVWRVLSDHLRDEGFSVLTYENQAQPSQPAMEVLMSLGARSSFALLIHTGEVRGRDNRMYAGPNVVHETGLFQMLLGPERTLIVREEGCEPVGNVKGLTEVCFSPNEISAAVGSVTSLIRRAVRSDGEDALGEGPAGMR